MTISGPTLRFNAECDFCLAGAAMKAELDGTEITFWTVLRARAGTNIEDRATRGKRCSGLFFGQRRSRCSRLSGKQVDVRPGPIRRTRRSGSSRRRCPAPPEKPARLPIRLPTEEPAPRILPTSIVPNYSERWELGVLSGPHGAPDFLPPNTSTHFFPPNGKSTTTRIGRASD